MIIAPIFPHDDTYDIYRYCLYRQGVFIFQRACGGLKDIEISLTIHHENSSSVARRNMLDISCFLLSTHH